jgi:hypothetical protein
MYVLVLNLSCYGYPLIKLGSLGTFPLFIKRHFLEGVQAKNVALMYNKNHKIVIGGLLQKRTRFIPYECTQFNQFFLLI